MRWKLPAGVLLTLALLIPTASAAAQTATSGPDKTTCQTVVYADIRKLVTINLDSASDTQVLVLANQILAASIANKLTVLPGRLQERLDGAVGDLRTFLKTELYPVWSRDLRIAIAETMANAGSNVNAAAQKALKAETIDAYLTYFNNDLCIARALDAGSQPVPSASGVSHSASPGTDTPTSSVAPSSGSAILPVTGVQVGLVAVAGLALLAFGGTTVVLARRRRIRFASEG